MTDTCCEALAAVWEPARVAGSLGSATIEELVAQASGYIANDRDLPMGAQCVDLGSGVGVPGLLLAMLYPETNWRLLDASARRCEIAQRAVQAVGLENQVEVIHGRADDYAHDTRWRSANDLVVSRLFGPPSEVAECGLPMLAPGGSLVVSVSAATAGVWLSADLTELSASVVECWETEAGRYLRVERTAAKSLDRLPRRVAARRRDPLF